MANLKGKTIVITGASRGIGREIALKCAQDGANIAILAKSVDAHPKLPGTIHTVAKEVEAAGGKALAIQLDVRDDEAVKDAMKKTAETFGGIDAVINNAGAIKLMGAASLPLKRFDLMTQINSRAVLSTFQAALPWLKKSDHGHIISLSPPINLDPKWFAHYAPYTITKYGMSMLTMGLAQEVKRHGISVNSLWPQTVISTAAVEFEGGGKATLNKGRTPAIMADAAYEILTTENCELTGEFLIDEALLRARGVTDFEQYRYNPDNNEPLMTDLFVTE
ncbi:SDR family oxidoreductase [Alkalimarinus alittae]|uniref:NAD(P)-dependent oxidoreductase n=1 Tax=Alkalimarinus alittae TaxID=2961619 RepID=A0ABY6MZW2_9ALTE|nr:NAD(P)-dependent oxidoreductase [Alkalimarinus alittae]UZE95386.1 NAD(P)-dependent oxidoreductase [Alkalimarinus alittae]